MKIQIFFISFILAIISSCTEKEKKFVHQFDRTETLGRKHKFFYSSYNLILTPNNKIYFHNKDSLLNCCDTGENYNFPDYIGLNPLDLSLIDKQDLIKIIQAVSMHKIDDKHSIQIALYSDTINSIEFRKIRMLMDSLHFNNFDVRLITEEEKVVVYHKESNQAYSFYKVNWTSRFSNTIFPPPQIEEKK